MTFALIFFLLPLNPSTYAQGAVGGNGGGIVQCTNHPSVVLDYYEAFHAVGEKKRKLLDIEKMSRASFFEIILSRLEKATERRKKIDFHEEPAISVAKYFNEVWPHIGTVDSWKSIPSTHQLDEAMPKKLPPDCQFIQAAITDKNVTHKILNVPDDLSNGQKNVLELHETLYNIQNWHLSGNFVTTSTSTRAFIQVLLKKKVSYPELRLAYLQYSYPLNTYAWKHGDISVVALGQDTNRLYRYMGAWALDMIEVQTKDRSLYSQCPNWLMVAPTTPTDSYVLQVWDSKTSESKFDGTWLFNGSTAGISLPLAFTSSAPTVALQPEGFCHYVRPGEVLNGGRPRIDFLDLYNANDSHREWRSRVEIKDLIRFYEGQPTEPQKSRMEEIRTLLSWY